MPPLYGVDQLLDLDAVITDTATTRNGIHRIGSEGMGH